MQWVTHEAAVELQWIMHQALVQHAAGFSGVGGGGLLDRLTISENPGKILGESRARRKNSGSHRQGILGNSGNFASSDGIVRGCANHAPRTAGISIM